MKKLKMQRNKKGRILAFVLSFLFAVTGPLSDTVVYAENISSKEETTKAGMSIRDSVQIEGTDSFGEMLSSELSAELEEQDSNEGCNIFSIEVSGTEASVSFETTEQASLVVAIYDENGIQMLASGKQEVFAGDTEATVGIDIENMPAYFYLRGFLIDSDSLIPLCSSYESPNYTQEMQEFFAKTTDDFNADKVLNLDDDKSNNFAVFSDSTKVIPKTAGVNIVSGANENENTYVIENANEEITSLVKGDTFAYEYEDGNTLIVKVASIHVDGTTATISGEDTSMDEVFDYVKIDTDADTSALSVDDSACAEGVTYNGLIDDSQQAVKMRAIDLEGEKSWSLSYTFHENEKLHITGSLGLKLVSSVKVYLSWSYQYLEAKIDYSAAVSFKIKAEGPKSYPLGTIGISPIAGVYIEFTPSIAAKVSASVEIDGELKGTMGLSVTSEGIKDLTSAPKFETYLKGEITLFIGLSLEPRVKVISDKIASAELEVLIGGEIKGSISTQRSSSEIHECNSCIDGEISAKKEATFTVKLLNSNKLKYSTSSKIKICDWYYSKDYKEFAFTSCPHYKYKVTVTVRDENKKPIKDATVTAPFTCLVDDGNGEKFACVSYLKTNDKGKAEGYLASGDYNVTVSAKGYKDGKKKVKVRDQSASVGLKLYREETSTDVPDEPVTNDPDESVVDLSNTKPVLKFMTYKEATGEDSEWPEYDLLNSIVKAEISEAEKIFYTISPTVITDYKDIILDDDAWYWKEDNDTWDIVIRGEWDKDFMGQTLYVVGWNQKGYSKIASLYLDGKYKGSKQLGNQITDSDGDGIRDTIAFCAEGAEFYSIVTRESGGAYTNYIENGQIKYYDDEIDGLKNYGWQIVLGITPADRNGFSSKTYYYQVKADDGGIYIEEYHEEEELRSRKMISAYSTVNTEVSEHQVNESTEKSFTGLEPYGIYNFYVMKDQESADSLNSSNLLYLVQKTADEKGSLQITYQLASDLADVDMFLVGNHRTNINNATVTVSDLTYTQKLQYVEPKVINDGKELTLWEDYELLGDYSASEIGTYTVIIHGINDYYGNIEKTFSIKASGESTGSSGGASGGAFGGTGNAGSSVTEDKKYPEDHKPSQGESEKPKKGAILTDNSTQAAYKVTTVGKSVAYWRASDKTIKKAVIPDTVTISGTTYKVTQIADSAFSKCTKLKNVTIGKNVTSIGNKAFYKCVSLSKIKMPSKVAKIGEKAFYGCKRLKLITIENKKLTSKRVGADAFKGTNLKVKVVVPKKMVKKYKKILKEAGLRKNAIIKEN